MRRHRRRAQNEGEIVVPNRQEQGKCAFQMVARFFVFTGEPVRHSGCAMGDAGLGRIGSRLKVTEGRGVPPHLRQLASRDEAPTHNP